MKTISPEVLTALDAAEKDGNAVRLVGQLERQLYTAVNKVLEAAGGKWNRKAKAHLFDGDAADALEPLILTGEYATPKQDFGQFDTPSPIVARLIHRAVIDRGMRVLEPSAGLGNIAVKAIEAGGVVETVEIDPERAARLVMRITKLATDDFIEAAREPYGRMGDFLHLTTDNFEDLFHRVVMNPPFAKGADIAHVRHAYDFLKPRGRLVAIMSPGWTFRQDRKFSEFREWANEVGAYVETLPDNAFKESGTNVSTIMVTIDKMS